MIKSYDLIVIGGGPGGYVAAIYAAQSGLKVACIEKENLGGVCLNWGCIPTKALLTNAEILRSVIDAANYGIDFDQSTLKIHYDSAQKRSREVSARLVKGVESLIKKNKIDFYHDQAKLASPTSVTLINSKETLQAKNIILATGSSPKKLAHINYDHPNILTSKDALEVTQITPDEAIIVVGAGAIGMEFSSIWSTYKAKVTIIEMMDHLLPNEDEQISKEIERAFKKQKINFHTNTKLLDVKPNDDQLSITIDTNGKVQTLTCNKLLISAGIKPNSADIGLEKVGIKVAEAGWIIVNEKFQTNCPSVYAIGDVTGKMALAHVASAHAMVVIDAILNKPTKVLNHLNMPRCTYTYPEVASVGLTEKLAIEKGYKVKVATFPLLANGKSVAKNQTQGMVKLVVDETYHELLGVHMVGDHVTELIHAPTAYIDLEITADELSKIVHPHPTVSEAIMEAAHIYLGHPIHI